MQHAVGQRQGPSSSSVRPEVILAGTSSGENQGIDRMGLETEAAVQRKLHLIPTARNADPFSGCRAIGTLLISRAARSLACSVAPPSARAYQSSLRAAGIRCSSIALIALGLVGCGTATNKHAQQPGWATQVAWTQFKACVRSVTNRPEYASLLAHTPGVDTMQPVTAQLTDEAIPSEQDARLFGTRFDEVNKCRDDLLMAVATPRPDLTPILQDEFTQADGIDVLVVERKITWAEAARRSQTLSSDVRQKIKVADLQWIAHMNPFHQADMAQLQAAAARSEQ
jgi:hypothetical protein